MMISTSDLSDSNPQFVNVVEPLFNNYGGRKSFHGEIVTVKCFEDNSLVKQTAETDGKGKVMVVDGGGSLRRALLGDLIAKDAENNGWEGFVIYGCIRDVDILQKIDLGVKALNTIPLKTEKKGVGDLNVPVSFGGVTFRPGEFIYADNNGILVSPVSLNLTD